jgi:hypothetical protein
VIDTNHYGNSTGGFEADEPSPTLILTCEACHAEIPFCGDGNETVEDGRYTLQDCEMVWCECGACFGEGFALGIVLDEQPVSLPTGAYPARALCEETQVSSLPILSPFQLAFEQSERELAARFGWPALVDDEAAGCVQPLKTLETFREALAELMDMGEWVRSEADNCELYTIRLRFEHYDELMALVQP